jgi:hypothetical protein
MAADHEPEKVLTKNPLGPSGEAVAANVERLLKDQNLTFAALSERLTKIRRPIPPLGLRKIVRRTRRVDADDLVGLAVAFGVSPISLLLPISDDKATEVGVTGIEERQPVEQVWDWLRANKPFGHKNELRAIIEFQADSWPGWADLPVALTPEMITEGKLRQGQHIRRRRAEIAAQEKADGDD